MKRNRVLSGLAIGTALFAIIVLTFYACSSGSGTDSKGTGAVTRSVAIYATDSMSDYLQVVATINKVSLTNSGNGASCDVLTDPTTINISNLANVLQLLNVTECAAVPYNRLHLEFAKSVDLMDQSGTKTTCTFASYKDDKNRPNALTCTNTDCTLDITGAVNVLAHQANTVALDFDLKDFDVSSFGTGSCSVTMKVTPIHGEGFKHIGHPEGVTGLVSNLSTSTQTFDLSKKHKLYHVLYSGITASSQPGLNDLLLRAQSDGLRTRVTTSSIDHDSTAITASAIVVKAEGLVSNLTTSEKRFSLTYKKEKTMSVDFSKAIVAGDLTDNALVEVKLYGYDTAGANFIASRIEVEYDDTVSEHDKKERETED